VHIVIRAAQRRDLRALLALYTDLNRDDPAPDPARAETVWNAIRAQPGRTVLVAQAESRVVGTIDVSVMANLTRGTRSIMYIENMVVSTDYRRRGIGARLLDGAMDIARSTHCYKAQLLSADDPGTHAFYEASGFTASARGYRRYL
jgi:GNAT superfamily N-acetyltransferase